MPQGKLKEVENIDGWLMKVKKEIPTLNEKIYHCAERTTKVQCSAAFGVHKSTGVIRVIKQHINHDKDLLSNAVKIGRQELKRRAENGNVRDVIDSVRADFGAHVSVAIGDYNCKRRLVHSSKARKDPDTNKMNSGGAISEKYKRTLDGDGFLIRDVTFNQERVLIFGSDVGLELLSAGKVLMVDGTFSCCPDGFTQLFTFHVYLSEDVVKPVVFALLPNKQLATYEFMINQLKRLPFLQNWKPDMIISDFEVNIKTAFERSFPTASFHGCLFHLIQSWRRRAEKLKLYDELLTGSLQDFWQLLKVLPFIEESKIGRFFEIIVLETVPNIVGPAVNEFIDYVDENYVRGPVGGTPRFSPSLWSCSLQTINGIHRTSNSVECWHRLLHSVTTMHHGFTKVKLSDLLHKLQMEERHTSMDWAELKINPNFKVIKSRKVSNIMKDRRLKLAVENNPPPPYLPLDGVQLLWSFVNAKKY
ncbi:hypothetical protein GCK72_012850 [Caenorhabditis remanei]|uniref:MULE transposase domain-containing protein n=1 Tax=Caenorhabditis remanei TaxID=31234 RepID=A0A6A5GM82_CAERE|nr:hypothetical protein GCK72_012850 [Caenorhabditis remanei]KAF1756397.1 hypothetical protein GCK72_012850 [Caenorhabditis remanei]